MQTGVEWFYPMLLKPDRTGRFNRFDREPVTAPVREEAKNQ
jgi:UDP-N-acetyl-D-mannosaminuronic acid transferase (WecB/TagA/CpsF family)